MDVEVRAIPEEDRRRWFEVVNAAFSGELREDEFEADSKIIPPERMLGAYADGALAGTAADIPLTLTIPGGELPAAGVTCVGVLPSHRRRGALTKLMEKQLQDARRRDEPLAILWASEGTIYGRYGYGIASRVVGIDADRAAFEAPADPAARVRVVDIDEAAEVFPPVYERIRRETPGMFERSSNWWKLYRLSDPEHRRHGAGPKFYALLELDGEAEGYAIYRVKPDWDEGFSQSQLRVQEALATSPRATREIWRFLFGVDLVARIRAWPLPPDHPLYLLAKEPKRLRVRAGDGLWLRIIDVERALSARSYTTEGELVVELSDPFLPENEGTWRLSTESGVDRSGQPELRLGAGALASSYLGEFSFGELHAAGLVEELVVGALARADALFHTSRAPWCPEVF